MPSICAIALGSNMGHRLDHLTQAVKLLAPLLKNLKWSTVYETKALLPTDAPLDWDKPYLNMVVTGEPLFNPSELIERLQKLEIVLGRSPNHKHWAPRAIDCDLLYYDDLVINQKNLTLPHPELCNRFFTAVPAAQLNPDWTHPITKQKISEIACQFKPLSHYFTRTLSLYPKLVGIVNITPDSFSDGGHFFMPIDAIRHAEKLYQEGAYVIDFGSQSTKPGARPLTWEEEWQRLQPVLSGFTSLNLDVKISIDTHHIEVAKRAIQQYPISWINNVFHDPAFLPLIEDRHYVITASGHTSVDHMLFWAKKQIQACLQAGLTKSQIILDPGIGFSKSPLETFQILQQLEKLKALGSDILIGHSRKPFWRICLTEPEKEADFYSCIVASHIRGIDYLRVHNVEKHQRALVLSEMTLGK